ncbi:SWIM zinc finger family protein [Actinokineospora sp. PR83]|uniref:SWIM zinc finger family protein n=1 Tax=Actinokineospora sp. PR83 TaxID=2884908 RepID=UPI0027E18C2B|nr:SWIM zinc finger family protein [Actinokineospora sp. PR83]MCG8918352.1 SWIM zinc finger family protein [Actinokineospora sp. PR83]
MGSYDEDEDDYDDGLAALFADEDDDEEEDDAEEVVDPHRRAVSFPAFPPHKRYGRKFADTWWGNAWTEAMQDTALDLDQLKSGRRYAFAGQVGPITVSPGRATAPVHDGDHHRPYTTTVRFTELSDAEWDRFLDKVAAKAGHIAALLDREMPRELVGAASDAGTRLLPGFGELDPDCDCPDWDSPCKHAAALVYQVSWLLDRDPFVLLLLRGRSESELTEELLRRNTGRSTSDADDAVAGVPAEQAWAAGAVALPAAPAHVHQVLDLAPLLADTDLAEAPVDAAAVAVLAADAADRAAALLAGRPVATDDPWSDAIRLAARGDDELRARAAAAGPRPAEFHRGVLAWALTGAEGLTTLEESWTPAKDVVARARVELADAWADAGLDGEPEAKVWRNRWTIEDRGWQLRLSSEGRWHPYTRDGAAWTPAGPPAATLTATLAELVPAE